MKKSLLLFVVLANIVLAANPDFTGDWTLNLVKSDYGKFPAPLSMTRKVDHKEPELVLFTRQRGEQGEVASRSVYRTDGKETVNQMAGGESKGLASWVGENLMIDSHREFKGAVLSQKDIWRLSEDGKTLTVNSHVSLPNGEFDVKQVFDRK